ncbi:MAG: hypothetical protein QF760_04095 [Candidatus Thalassarchaeaceae archaeon]|nr:hypothetical protein [Candidatus Thalassarchaeaceae archaeon]MDP6703686.1 hypothetical protein [Candidatus Thalassarchaeaceae archaeon]
MAGPNRSMTLFPNMFGPQNELKSTFPGASILMFEPTGTLSTGDSQEGPIPEGVDKTTGHKIN